MKRAPIKRLPSVKVLHRLLTYDERTGLLRWKVIEALSGVDSRRNKLFAGKVAGHLDSVGYVRVTINGSDYFAHRIIWLMVTGDEPRLQIDHINGDPVDNRWSNLRVATQNQNQANRKLSCNNTSGFKGASFIRAHQKWRAAISINNKKRHLGYFDSAEEAAQAFRMAEKSLRGSFARSG